MNCRFVLCAAVFVASSFVAQPGRAQNLFDGLLRRVPGDANALVMINVAKARGSAYLRREGPVVDSADRYVFAPSEVDLLVRAANLDVSTLQPAWEMTVLTTKSDLQVGAIARYLGGRTDSLAGLPAVWLPVDGYLIRFGPRLAGMYYPGDRQCAARWAESAQSAERVRLSPYLRQAAGYPETVGTEMILAMDLSYSLSPEVIRQKLPELESLQGKRVDPHGLSEVLASIRGVTLGVRVMDQATASLRIDFERDAGIVGDMAKPLILEILARQGATIDDMADWSAEVRGATIFSKGTLTKSGLGRILSLVQPPSPPLKQPELGTPEVVSPGDSTAEATRQQYEAVQSLLRDLHHPSGNLITTGQYALWIDRYARKLDALPILGVDKDMVEFTGWVASVLRSVASGYRKVGMEAAKYSNNPTVRAHSPHTAVTGGYYRRGYWGTSRGFRTGTAWEYSAGPAPSVIAMRLGRVDAAASEKQVLEYLDNAMAEMRRVMTERYQIEF